MATYSADISVKVVGLTQLKNLENRLTQLQERFTKINAASAQITAPFKAHIQALQTMNTLLQQNGRLLNAQASAVERATGKRGGGGRGAASPDARLEKERSDELQRQLGLLKDRARVLQGNTAIMVKLLRAEVEITAAAGGNVKLGKELMKNARSLLAAEERLAKTKAAAADQGIADAERERKARVKAVEDEWRAVEQVLKKEKSARGEVGNTSRGGGGALRTGLNVAGRAGGAIDRAFGGGISGAGRAVEGAVIRGGAVAGGLAAAGGVSGLGNMFGVKQAVGAITNVLPDALGGAITGVGELVSALANLPGGMGAAAVAAAAFAPWLPKIAQGAYAAGDALGKLEAAQPLKNFVNQGGASFFESATNALGGASAEIKSITGGPALDLSRKSGAFGANLDAQLMPKIAQQLVESAMAEAAAADKVAAARSSWVSLLKEGRAVQQQVMQATRAEEQIASEAARKRLADAAAARGTVFAPARYPGMGDAGNNPSGLGQFNPAGNTMTAQPGYRAMLNARAATGQAAEAVRAASTTKTQAGFEAQMLRTSENLLSVKQRISAEDSKSVTIARERNRILMEQYKAEQRKATGQLDPASLRAQRRVRVAKGRERQQRVGELGESLALGVGFPLLFGAGAGSIGGSLAGSFVGKKGFGGQILGGAIGAKLDEFLLATTELATGLTRLTSIFDTLKEKSLISSRALEKQIERTEEAGFSATANAAAQRVFTSSVGAEGANNLVRLGEAADASSRQWAIAVARIQSRVAGPLGAAQNFLAKGGEIANLTNRKQDLAGELQNRGKGQAAQKLLDATNPFASFGKSQEQVIANLKQAIAEAEKSLPPVKIKLDATQVREELITRLEKELQGIDLARTLTNQIRGRAREQEDLDQQRAEMVLQNERAIADLRQSIEDKIADARLSNLQRENELFRVQGEIRAKALELSTRNLGTGATDSRVNEAGSAIADYLQKELEIANDAAAIKRDAALEVNRIDIETERFKLQVATQLTRMAQDSAKRVADINKGVRRSNQDQDNRKFELEREIARLRLEGIKAEMVALNVTAKAYNVEGTTQDTFAVVKALTAGIEELKNLKPPAALKEIGGVGVGGATTGGLDAVNARATTLINSMATARQDLLALAQDGNLQALQERLKQIFADPLDKAKATAQALFVQLIQGFGLVSSEAASDAAGLATLNTGLDDLNKKIQANSKLTDEQKAAFGAWIKLLKGAVPELTKQVEGFETINDRLKSLNDKYLELQDALEALKLPYGELTEVQKAVNDLTRKGIDLTSAEAQALIQKAEAVDALNDKLRKAKEDQERLQELLNGIGNEISNGVVNGLVMAVSATDRLGDAMQELAGDILAAIGKALILSAITGALNGMAGDDGVGFFSILAGKFKGRASGGPISGGEPYIVGEEGPELILPQRNGYVLNADQTQNALAQSRGALGGGGVTSDSAFSENRDALNTISSTSRERQVERWITSGAGSTEIKYSRVGAGDLPFVTEQDMLQATRVAAQEGARMGQQRTMAALKNNPGARRTIGI